MFNPKSSVIPKCLGHKENVISWSTQFFSRFLWGRKSEILFGLISHGRRCGISVLHTTLPINCFWVVADQANSGLQLYTEELLDFTPHSSLSRGFWEGGCLLDEEAWGRSRSSCRCPVVCWRIAVRNSHGVSPTSSDRFVKSRWVHILLLYASLERISGRRRVHLFYYRVLSSTTTYHKVVLGRRYT